MRLALLGLVTAVAVLAVVAALSTPVTAVAQNPYVVGGELELPKAAAGGADAALLVCEPTPFGLHDLALAVEVVRAAMRAYREDWRKGVGGGVTALVLGLSPVAAGALNNTLRHAGALYQLESIDLQRLRRDCADLVSRLPPTARSRVIHIDNPAFARLPAGVRALNPLVVRVTRRYVEVIRYGMVARREGVIVVPAGRDCRPEHAGREFAVGVYRLNW